MVQMLTTTLTILTERQFMGSQGNATIVLKLRYEHFLPDPLQFITQ